MKRMEGVARMRRMEGVARMRRMKGILVVEAVGCVIFCLLRGDAPGVFSGLGWGFGVFRCQEELGMGQRLFYIFC